MTASIVRLAVAATALVLVSATDIGYAKPPKLGRNYSGTYLRDGSSSPDTFNMEVGDRTSPKHWEHVSVFARNQPEFQGDGDVKKMNKEFHCDNLKATGNHAPKMALVANVISGGDTLEGTYTVKRWRFSQALDKYHFEVVETGTFSVSR